ncbi:MAG: DUF3347 domain-containing protein [Bacteroidota bacterium]
MKNSIKKLLIPIYLLVSVTSVFGHSKPILKNQKSVTATILGNCNTCKSAIEKAGSQPKTANVEWNLDTKKATILFDSKKTNSDEILKRIALAGFDSDQFLAPDQAYAKLDDCCKYERVSKVLAKNTKLKIEKNESENHSEMASAKELVQLELVFDKYFALKDALVATNGTLAADKAKELQKAIAAVKMNELEMNAHMAWMKVLKSLNIDSERIASSKDTAVQRDHFMALSKNMYELMKVAKSASPIYYQYCPMANDNKGANWLSKEAGIKNPYYGSEMLTCGKTVETIK